MRNNITWDFLSFSDAQWFPFILFKPESFYPSQGWLDSRRIGATFSHRRTDSDMGAACTAQFLYDAYVNGFPILLLGSDDSNIKSSYATHQPEITSAINKLINVALLIKSSPRDSQPRLTEGPEHSSCSSAPRITL